MTDLAQLESEILADIAAADGEAALEAVRVAALGKKGSISALLATLGKMSPDERKTQGAAINLAKDKVTQALAARRDILKSAALDARLASETIDVTLPLREGPAEAGRIHPLSQVMDEIDRDLRRHGICHRRRAGHRDRRLQFHQAEFPAKAIRRGRCTTRSSSTRRPDGSRMLLRTHTSPVQVRTMLSQKPPIRVDLPGPHLPHRFRRHPYAACSTRSRASSSTRARISAT